MTQLATGVNCHLLLSDSGFCHKISSNGGRCINFTGGGVLFKDIKDRLRIFAKLRRNICDNPEKHFYGKVAFNFRFER